jgi:hypothetical protein
VLRSDNLRHSRFVSLGFLCLPGIRRSLPGKPLPFCGKFKPCGFIFLALGHAGKCFAVTAPGAFRLQGRRSLPLLLGSKYRPLIALPHSLLRQVLPLRGELQPRGFRIRVLRLCGLRLAFLRLLTVSIEAALQHAASFRT